MKTKTFLLIAVMAVSVITNAQIWMQKGADFNGEAEDDILGNSVSMPDLNTLAIGAPGNDDGGIDAGKVRIFKWDPSTKEWVQKGADIDGEASGDLEGYSVSMPDPNTLAIGAPMNDDGGFWAGQVRIFKWNPSTTEWVQKGGDIEGGADRSQDGSFVSMPDSNTVAIGGYTNSDTGQVHIYQWSGNAWVQKGTDIEGEAVGDLEGNSVSMPDPNTLAIGAPFNDGGGDHAGQVRIFKWNPSTTEWVQKGDDIEGEAAYDVLGYFVSMPDSNNVAIGVPYDIWSGSESDSGHVCIYTWNDTTWVKKGANIIGEAAKDGSGISVSMPDPNTVAIGACQNDGNGLDAGHVRIYHWSDGSWLQKGDDIDGKDTGDWAGYFVSMPDPETVAIGAPYGDANASYAGNVRVFFLCTTTSTISPNACDSYTSPSAKYTWTSSGTYLDTIPNAAGCDSIITINLTINTVDVSVINTSTVLTANATDAAYQWLDCENNYAIIPGEKGISFTASTNGNYAVEVTKNGCTDTSSCENVTVEGIIQNNLDKNLMVFPNPSNGNLFIDLGKEYPDVRVIIRNELGQEVCKLALGSVRKTSFFIPGDAGIYFIEIETINNRKALIKVIRK
jgi:hypothetical protein